MSILHQATLNHDFLQHNIDDAKNEPNSDRREKWNCGKNRPRFSFSNFFF